MPTLELLGNLRARSALQELHATQLSSLSYDGKEAASLFKDGEEKRGILADIERLFKGGVEDLSSPATSEFIYTETSFNVALYRAVQDLQAKRGM